MLGSGAAIQVAGPAVIITYVLSALISWTVAMALGEMSAVHPAAGSFGVYAELYLNPWAGFIARYGYWFSVVIAIGSELVAAATYMRQWYPEYPVVWMVVVWPVSHCHQSFFGWPLRDFRILVRAHQSGHDFCFYRDGRSLAVCRQRVHPEYLTQAALLPTAGPRR